MKLGSMFAPNRMDSPVSAIRIMIAGQITVFILWWAYATPAVIPKPLEVVQSFGDLWSTGLVGDLYTSLILYLQALFISTVFSLLLAYSSSLMFFRPAAELWSKLRFLGMVGLNFLFTLYLSGAHSLKLAMLTFSISVFMLTSMLDILDQIPREKFDLARTLRMGEWQILWEVQILGRADVMFDAMRQNGAIGWMMLAVVEGLFRSEGGLGMALMNQDKHFHLGAIAAIQILFLGLGLTQDYILGVLKNMCCPYARLLLERR
jgi:NitT/TauT family transport system permease protein